MSNEENNETQHEFIRREYVECAINNFKDKFGRQAMILLMLSGMKGSVIRNLRINNLLDACTPYFGHKPSLEELLETDPIKEEIIPVWTFDKNRLLCSTSQSLHYILKHLQKRIDTNSLNGGNNAYLFIGENYNMDKLSKNHPFDFISDFKKKLNKNKPKNEIDFTARNLVYTFQSIYEEHLPKNIKEDENYKKEILIKIFKGEYLSKSEKKYYDSILEDKSILINIYKKYLLKHLTIEVQEYEVSNDRNEGDNKNIVSSEVSDDGNIIDKSYTDEDIRLILKDYFYKLFTKGGKQADYDAIFTWRNIAFPLAKKDNYNSLFEETDNYLNKLCKRTRFRLFFKDKPEIELHMDGPEDASKVSSKLTKLLDSWNFFEHFKVNKDYFGSVFVDIFECDGMPIMNTEFIITAIESAYYINNNGRLYPKDVDPNLPVRKFLWNPR